MTEDKLLDILLVPVLFVVEVRIRLRRVAEFIRASDDERARIMAELREGKRK